MSHFAKIAGAIVAVCLFAFAAAARADQGPPPVSRWMDPTLPVRPHHAPPAQRGPLDIKELKSPRGKFGVALAGGPRIAVIVTSTLHPSVQTALDQYFADLQLAGYNPVLHQYTTGTAADLRAYLLGLYNEADSLEGAVFIGEVPYVIFELNQDWGDGPEYEDFVADVYFMDLDGVWTDVLDSGTVKPANGKLDTRAGNRSLEIWVSRMRTANLPAIGTETDLLNSYFDKNHRYRTGELSPGLRGLAYTDDDWASAYGNSDRIEVEDIYGADKTTSVTDLEQTNVTDWQNVRMPALQELIHLRSHGSYNGHCFETNAGATRTCLLAGKYPELDPPALFYSLFVCSGTDFFYDNYLGGTIVFNPADSGLVAWGSSKTGGIWADDVFWDVLADDGSIGEAFIQWYNDALQKYPSYEPSWWLGMNIIGDGALSLKMAKSDYDNDGMPNNWERSHACMDPETADAALDPDGDGRINRQEFLKKKNPCKKDVATSGGGSGGGGGCSSLPSSRPGAYAQVISLLLPLTALMAGRNLRRRLG